MAKTNGLLIAALAAIAVTGSAQPAAAQNLTVTLHLRNDARILDDEVEQAEAIVTDIYAKAGVTVSWTSHAQLTIVIVPRDRAAGLNQSVEAMGFAPGTENVRGTIAFVLAHRVDQAAEKCGAEKGVVLGAAIAHEIGHLLLPFNAHSETGVMRADVTQADFRHAAHGQLLFTDEQAAEIRSRMALD